MRNADEKLIAVENALLNVADAMEELEGHEDLKDHYWALKDIADELEAKKDELESYLTGEWRQEQADMARDYYRSVI